MGQKGKRGILALILVMSAAAVGILAGLVYFLRTNPADTAAPAGKAHAAASGGAETYSGAVSPVGETAYSAEWEAEEELSAKSDASVQYEAVFEMDEAKWAFIVFSVAREVRPVLDEAIAERKAGEAQAEASGEAQGEPAQTEASGEAQADPARTEAAAAPGEAATEAVPAEAAAGAAEAEQGFDCAAQLLRSRTDGTFWEECPARDVELLTPNEYSRPQTAIDTVNNIVIHYVGNPGSSAMDNRNYFESLKDSRERSASSHFVIGLEGEIVQCIPLSEVAYATKWRNSDTISIECCHPDADGKFNEYTYGSLVRLSAFLCMQFHIDPQGILRHYDVTEKLCPLYYVEHPDAWQQLKDDIEAKLYEMQGN